MAPDGDKCLMYTALHSIIRLGALLKRVYADSALI